MIKIEQTHFVEKIKANYDIADLIESVRSDFHKFPSVQRSPAVGGWAVQSTNGSYKDGWSHDFCPYNGPKNQGPFWQPRSMCEKALPDIQSYTWPTEVTTKPFIKLLTHLENLGLNPRRARVIKLTANSTCIWHQDGSPIYYQARIHIPLITNESCFFEVPDGQYHMQADGSFYFVHINRLHRVVNHGLQDRYHFVAHIWDQNQFTQNHQYSLEKNVGDSFHLDEI